MTELCEIYDIARETGYYWLRRDQLGGLEALQDRDRTPSVTRIRHRNGSKRRYCSAASAHEMGPAQTETRVRTGKSQTQWRRRALSGALLAREGLVVPRKKRRRAPPYTEPFASADAPNQVWCADFKGWFRTADGERIDPLTISDAYSRYLLRCQHVAKTNGEQVQAIFEARFANTVCRRRFGPITVRRLRRGPWRGCRAWRRGG